MKTKFIIGFICLSTCTFGQGFLAKSLAKLAKMAGSANVVEVSTLDDITPTITIGSNLYPKEVGTISQTFFTGWVPGGDMINIMLSKKNTAGFVKVDGSVTIDGMVAEYVTSGMYSLITVANKSPRKVEITTKSGQKSSFIIEPYNNPVKLISINGNNGNNVSVDLTKDVVLEIESDEVSSHKPLRVSIAINQLGIKSFYQVCNTKLGTKVTIPAAAFRNINIKPGNDLVYNYKNSFIQIGIENIESAKNITGVINEIKYTKMYEDGKFVTITTEPNLNKGLSSKGEDKATRMNYDFTKANAFLSRPSSQISKVGLISLAIRGTTFEEYSNTETNSSSFTAGGIKTTTTTTKTTITKLEFPQQPNEVWDAVLERVYPDVMKVLNEEFSSTTVPLESITNCAAYKFYENASNDNKNTKVNFSRAYKNTKLISAFMPVSEGYGINGTHAKIMKESGANALFTMTIDLEISESKDGKVLMVPKFAFELIGAPNGNNTNTKYFTGKAESITGVPFKTTLSVDDIESIIRKSDMLKVFTKALRELKEKELSNGDYKTVWELQ